LKSIFSLPKPAVEAGAGDRFLTPSDPISYSIVFASHDEDFRILAHLLPSLYSSMTLFVHEWAQVGPRAGVKLPDPDALMRAVT